MERRISFTNPKKGKNKNKGRFNYKNGK